MTIVKAKLTYFGKTVTKARALEAAQQRFGHDVEALGYLNTIGRASGPYARDGQKEFHALVRFKSRSSYDAAMLINLTAPSAAEAWLRVLRVIANNPVPGDELLAAAKGQTS
jgi:hypothetical protein